MNCVQNQLIYLLAVRWGHLTYCQAIMGTLNVCTIRRWSVWWSPGFRLHPIPTTS